MGILDDIKIMQEKISKLPPVPKEIRMTREVYYAVERNIPVWKRLGVIPKNPYPFPGIRLWLEDDFENWTDEEMAKGFKVVY